MSVVAAFDIVVDNVPLLFVIVFAWYPAGYFATQNPGISSSHSPFLKLLLVPFLNAGCTYVYPVSASVTLVGINFTSIVVPVILYSFLGIHSDYPVISPFEFFVTAFAHFFSAVL